MSGARADHPLYRRRQVVKSGRPTLGLLRLAEGRRKKRKSDDEWTFDFDAERRCRRRTTLHHPWLVPFLLILPSLRRLHLVRLLLLLPHAFHLSPAWSIASRILSSISSTGNDDVAQLIVKCIVEGTPPQFDDDNDDVKIVLAKVALIQSFESRQVKMKDGRFLLRHGN